MERPFSDVRVEMSARPTQNFSLTLDSDIPVYGNSGFRTLKIGSSLRDEAGNAAGIEYIYKDEEFGYVATDYVRVRLATSLLKPVYLTFEERYDLDESRELEKVVGLEYRSKCWSVLLTYRDRYRENDDNDQEVVFTFTLAGIGLTQGVGSSSRSILQ
jgi:LPS-assembly protein